jgi:hypothetical protein
VRKSSSVCRSANVLITSIIVTRHVTRVNNSRLPRRTHEAPFPSFDSLGKVLSLSNDEGMM